MIFTTLKQDGATPQFARPDRCLGCHLSANSLSVPGILVRSMSTAPDGRPMPQDGSFVIDHRSRLDQRWAGWYVSGAAASVQHIGRTIGPGLDLSAYPLPTSDIAALLVFDHQGHAINLLTRLGWETRFAAAEGRLDFTKGDLGDILQRGRRLFSVHRRNADGVAGAGRLGVREIVRIGRAARSQGAIAARAGSADAALQVPLQLHDLFTGIRRASDGGARGDPRIACASWSPIATRSRFSTTRKQAGDNNGAVGVRGRRARQL